MRTRRATAYAASLLTVVLAVTACGKGGDEGPQSLDDIAASDTNTTGRDKVKDGGKMVWGIQQPIQQFQRHHTDGNLAENATMLQAMMPSAFKFDDKGTPHPYTPFVEDFEKNDDNTEFTYTLNPDAKWSNGKPITWEDYAQQARTLAGDEKGDFKSPGKMWGYDRIDTVEKGKDDYEFTVKFDEPFGEYGYLFEFLYPKEYTKDPKKFNEGYLEDLPVTAGPFDLEGIKKSDETVHVVRNDDWWGEPAKLDEIFFQPGDPEGQANSFKNKELDAFYVGYNAPVYETAQQRDDGHVTEAIDNGYRYLEMNAQSEFLKDVDVRHAIMKAIDRKALAKVSLSGIDWPSDPTANRLLRSSDPGFKDNSGDLGKQDVDAARKLLDEAGWKLEGDAKVRTNDEGKEFKVRYFCPAEIQACTDESKIVKDQLKDVGIQVSIETREPDTYFEDYIYTGDYELSSFVLDQTTPYAGEGFENYTGPFGKDKKDWGNNNARTSTDEINDRFEDLAEESDPEEYAKIANEIDRALWENGQGIPFFQRTGTWAVRDDLANVGARGLSSLKYEDIGYVK